MARPSPSAPAAPSGEDALGRLSFGRFLAAETLRVLGLNAQGATDELALASLISRGLAARAIDRLVSFGIPEDDIYRHVIPRRTFRRRRNANERLTPAESDRAERVARIAALARAVFEDKERAVKWLSTAKRRFENQRPLDLIGSGIGSKVVEDALLEAYFGNVA